MLCPESGMIPARGVRGRLEEEPPAFMRLQLIKYAREHRDHNPMRARRIFWPWRSGCLGQALCVYPCVYLRL
jgi:hypothetical protein